MCNTGGHTTRLCTKKAAERLRLAFEISLTLSLSLFFENTHNSLSTRRTSGHANGGYKGYTLTLGTLTLSYSFAYAGDKEEPLKKRNPVFLTYVCCIQLSARD